MQLARTLAIGLILSGCALSPQKRGTVTVEGIDLCTLKPDGRDQDDETEP
jgi:hypothetical protein